MKKEEEGEEGEMKRRRGKGVGAWWGGGSLFFPLLSLSCFLHAVPASGIK